MRRLILCAVAFLLVGCGAKNLPDAIDFSMTAYEAGDLSAVLEGCNQGVRNGYLFCRMPEGADQSTIITLHFPKVSCKRTNCIEYQVVMPSGELGHGLGIGAGETKNSVRLSQITGKSGPISKDHAGEYRLLVKVWFLVEDEEMSTRADAVLRLFVVDRKYQGLVCNDPETGWRSDLSRSCSVEYSTGYRTAVCGDGCSPEVQRVGGIGEP